MHFVPDKEAAMPHRHPCAILHLWWLIFSFILIACGTASTTTPPLKDTALPHTPLPTTIPTAIPATAIPATATATTTPIPVTGPAPNPRLGAFYYAWYGNPRVDGTYIYWEGQGGNPPAVLSSDYYPLLGDYSSNDPAVIEQHMAWLRQAGVGFIVVSWWGPRGTTEARPVEQILDAAARFGIQVTFHIEPYDGRSAQTLAADVRSILDRYGKHPAFMKTTLTSPFTHNDHAVPIFFVWSAIVPANGKAPIHADYWQPAIDAIHSFPEQPLMIADTLDAAWVNDGHFDGLYNYITLNTSPNSFAWAQTLPPDALYIPSVIPGNSAKRIGYDPSTTVDRQQGATYDAQWQNALSTGVKPALVTITSFNEWHEGSQIEPARDDDTFDNYAPLAPEAYLDQTKAWSERWNTWVFPAQTPIRITLHTSSDWSMLDLTSTQRLAHPHLNTVSPEVTMYGVDAEHQRVYVNQDIAAAMQQQIVTLEYDFLITSNPADTLLTWHITRGNIGRSEVTIACWQNAQLVPLTSTDWRSLNDTLNTDVFQIDVRTCDVRP